MEIRPERPGDEGAIRALIDAAFAPKTHEARIVDALRGGDRWIAELALVAVDDAGRIVGHCVTSRGYLTAPDGTEGPILALGPIAVVPDRQGEGIGGALITATAARATAAGWPVIVLLGHSDYYPRYGFERASPLGLEAPGDVPDPAWMALRLPAWTPKVRGRMRFPAAFDDESSPRRGHGADG
jgi:predicted N-acetyltransferase YhbS